MSALAEVNSNIELVKEEMKEVKTKVKVLESEILKHTGKDAERLEKLLEKQEEKVVLGFLRPSFPFPFPFADVHGEGEDLAGTPDWVGKD
jgi:hypothetical protein